MTLVRGLRTIQLSDNETTHTQSLDTMTDLTKEILALAEEMGITKVLKESAADAINSGVASDKYSVEEVVANYTRQGIPKEYREQTGLDGTDEEWVVTDAELALWSGHATGTHAKEAQRLVDELA